MARDSRNRAPSVHEIISGFYYSSGRLDEQFSFPVGLLSVGNFEISYQLAERNWTLIDALFLRVFGILRYLNLLLKIDCVGVFLIFNISRCFRANSLRLKWGATVWEGLNLGNTNLGAEFGRGELEELKFRGAEKFKGAEI